MIKKLQERLQQKIDEASLWEKKFKELQSELEKVKKAGSEKDS